MIPAIVVPLGWLSSAITVACLDFARGATARTLVSRRAFSAGRLAAERALRFLPVSFPKIISGHTDDVGQPERGLRRPCQSVESAVRAGNLYSKPDAYAF